MAKALDQHARLWLAACISFGIAALVVLTDVGQHYIRMSMHDPPRPTIGRLLLWPSIWWFSWALLAVGVYWISCRYVITKDHWKSAIVVHVLACLIAYATHVSIQIACMALPAYQTTHADWNEAIAYHVVSSIFTNILTYWGIVGASHAFIFYSRYRQREVQAAVLESELHKAQLSALIMQLRPHFLFNTLNAISSLMYRNVEEADRMIAQLGDLLRSTIDMTGVTRVTLNEEIQFLQQYLQIEEVRFGNRLSVTIDVADNVQHAIVPNLILQPLVENAVKHGIAQTSEPGHVEIKAWREQDWLLLSVSDNGPGLATGDGLISHGTGLTNTEKRLATQYASNHALNFRPNTPRGLIVEISIPCQYEEEPVTAP